MDTLLTAIILIATISLVLIRPKNVSEAWWAIAGGGLVLVLGLVSVQQAGSILLKIQDALVLLVGMMALSAIAEKAGFFDWAASLAARAGRGSAFRLYCFVFLLGTLITAVLSLDATAIILTPIIYEMVDRLRIRPLPFMFACVYTANTASLFLPISNLTNLLVYDSFGLDFMRFGLIMFVPSTLAVLASALVIALLFRKDLRGSYDEKPFSSVPENTAFFGVATGAIVVVLMAFFAAPIFGIPIGLVALIAAVIAVTVVRLRGWMSLPEVASSISWGIFALVIGLFLVVQGVENVGLTEVVRQAFAAAAPSDGFLQILGVAMGSGVGSNLINNLPAALLSISALKTLVTGGALGFAPLYAVILGTNIGPNLSVAGSLATLIWLSILRSKGVKITAKDYLKIGAISTPVILLSAVGGLWVSLKLLGS